MIVYRATAIHQPTIESFGFASLALQRDSAGTEKPKTKHLKKEQINVGIYPNPATSNITVVGKQMQAITVMDAMGKVVLRKNCNTESLCTINVANLNSGLYIVQVQQKDGSIVAHKLIKQ